MRQHNHVFSLLILISLCSVLANCALAQLEYVYRADARSPEEIKKTGGFVPRGMSAPGQIPLDISLFNHANGAVTGFSRDNEGFVSTSSSLPLALYWVASMLNGKGYVYKIHVAPNLIDVNASLRKYSPFPHEQEFAAIGGIKYDQIKGWIHSDGKKKENQQYSKQYDALKDGGVQYQLSGFPDDHTAWKDAPWKSFSTCSNKRMEATQTCKPTDSAYGFAKKYLESIKM